MNFYSKKSDQGTSSKAIAYYVLCALGSLFILNVFNIGCQNGGGGSSSSAPAPAPGYYGNYATTPQPCNYMQQVYGQNSNPYGSYGYGNGYASGYPYGGYSNTPYNGTGYGYGSYGSGYAANCSNYNMSYPYWNQSQAWGAGPSWNYGAWIWPTNWAPQSGFCGCPSGYRPVMSTYYGMSCAPDAYFGAYAVVWFNWGYFGGQYQNNQWLNNQQMTYQGNNGCNQIAQGCDVRLNNCPGGQFCQPVGGGSTIGLCIR